MRRAFTWASASLAISLLSSSASAQTIFHGRDINDAAKRSIDIVNDHLVFQQAQARYRSILWYIGYTHRWAPGQFQLDDGRRVSGNLTRVQFNLGGGFGNYETFGVFVGASVDLVAPLARDGGQISALNWTSNAGQNLAFIGVVGHGFQATFGQMQNNRNPSDLGLDPYGRFTAGDRPRYRAGAPGELTSTDDAPWIHNVVTVYHDSGAFLGITYARHRSFGVDENRISDVRFNFQPLKRYLPDLAGLPTFGIAKLDGLKKYYADALDARQGPQPGAATPTPGPAAIPAATSPYEIELGTDDALGIGARVRLYTEVYPNPSFRRADFAITQVRPIGRGWALTGAARAITFRRNIGGMSGAADAFALIGRAPFRDGEHVGWPMHFGLAYSYNSPDGSTFLPIPNAHVFGFQFVAGVPETSKPIIPIVREVRDGKKVGFYDEEPK